MPIRTLFLFLLLAVSCSAVSQSKPSLTAPKDAPEKVSKIFAAFDHTDTPGCAVAVSGRRQRCFTRGLRHGRSGTPCRARSRLGF